MTTMISPRETNSWLVRSLDRDKQFVPAQRNNVPRIWHVNSRHPQATGATAPGTVDAPFSSVAAALQASGNRVGLDPVGAKRADRIVVHEWHAETILAADGWALREGVQIVGLGHGGARPQILIGGATTADIQVDVASVLLDNLVLVCDETGADLVRMLHVTGSDCVLSNLELREGSSTRQALTYLLLAAGANRTKIVNCQIFSRTAGSNQAVYLGAALDEVQIENLRVEGNFAVAGVENPTSAVCTNLLLRNAAIRQMGSGKGVQFTSASLGDVIGLRVSGTSTADALVNSSMTTLDCRAASAAGVADLDLPTVGGPIGSRFWVSKTLVSSAILVTPAVDVTGASSAGKLAIVDVVLKTDGTGLAGMTNLRLQTDNAAGAAVFLETAASGLGANATIDLANASVTKKKVVLEQGKKVQAAATASDGTGAGTVTIEICFERYQPAGRISAA